MQCPEGVNGRGIDANFVNRGVIGDGPELRGYVGIFAFHQQSLRGHAPELIGMFQRHQQARRVGHFQVRHERLRHGFVIAHAVDASVSEIAQVGFVGIATSIFEARRHRVVLNNIAIPVGHPNSTIGTGLGKNRREPFVGTRHKVEVYSRAWAFGIFVVAAPFLHHVLVYNMPGGFTNEGHIVPVGLRKGAGGVEIMARRRCKTAEHIDLPHALGNGFHVFVRIRTSSAAHAVGAGVVGPVRNGHVPAVAVVGRRAKHVAGFVETHAPGIVRRDGHVLYHRPVGRIHAGLKPKQCLPEIERIGGAHFALKSRIAYATPDPVVEAVVQVARPGVGVERAKTSEQNLLHIGLVVAVGIFQKQHVRGLRHNEATVGKH